MGPLRVHPQNPRYFADGSGRAVYLTGSHTWANLQDQGPKDPPKPFDYGRYLDFLRERNHNVIRLWAWEQARWAPWSDGKGQNPSDWFISPNPYARTGPGKALDGKPKFDLEKWDDAYFDRLRTRVRQAGERGIYVSVMLFQGWSSAKGWLGGTPWRGHPYHPENNVQGLSGNTKGDTGPALDDPRVRERQAAYIRKVIDTLNDLDNVLYEVTNEGGDQGLGPLRRRHGARLREDQAQAAPGRPHRPRLGEQRRDAREPRRLVLAGLEPVARPEGRPACRRRQEGQPARHRPRLRRRRRPEVGLEGVPAGPQRAVHGPLRRPRLGADPRRPGGGRARRRGVPAGRWGTRAATPGASTSPPAGRPASWPRPGTAWRSPAGSTWSTCPTAAR